MLFQDPDWYMARGQGRDEEDSWYRSPSSTRMQERLQALHPGHPTAPLYLDHPHVSVYHIGADGFNKYNFSALSTSK